MVTPFHALALHLYKSRARCDRASDLVEASLVHPQCTLSEDQPRHVSARGHANSMSLDCNFLRRQSRNSLNLRASETQGKKTQIW